MKKILILAYYYPPCIGIAANRPAAFANNFSKNHEVKVITRHWQGNENNWSDYLSTDDRPQEHEFISETLEIIRTPFVSKVKPPNIFRTISNLISGKLDPEIDSLQLKDTASQVIVNWKPDVILVSSPPLNIIHLASQLSSEFKVPFFADFRDFENEFVLTNRKHSPKKYLFFYFRLRQIKRDMLNCSGFSTINKELFYFINKLTKKEGIIILNGFEKSIFDQFKPLIDLKIDQFQVSIIGTIYENQAYEIFLDAFNTVSKEVPSEKIKFNFYGTNSIPEIGEKIKNKLPENYITLTNRIPRSEALKKLEESHLLWQPEMVGFKGIYSGKIFEYLGAKRPIIIAPSQGDVLDTLMEETGAGKSFKTSDEIASYIIYQYNIWKKNGTIDYTGDDDEISLYTRENQAASLEEFIRNILN